MDVRPDICMEMGTDVGLVVGLGIGMEMAMDSGLPTRMGTEEEKGENSVTDLTAEENIED